MPLSLCKVEFHITKNEVSSIVYFTNTMVTWHDLVLQTVDL